jgi:predicted molibdopterin-dependent oxidoreductase YjgC
MTDNLFITINRNHFPFKEGETILDVARKNHIDIPTLCHLKGAFPTGECQSFYYQGFFKMYPLRKMCSGL